MKKTGTKIISAILIMVLTISMSSVVFADTFVDMPNDWRKTAIENAVKNGLISGKGDGRVAPDDNITRAEMASIIVRALGAKKEADLSKFKDVKEGSWYYKEFSKAVYMNAFEGNDQNLMNPTGNITFQECFIVLSKTFGLDIRMDEEEATTVLSAYSDAGTVAPWAKIYYASIVKGGYWTGGPEGKLRGADYINRGEFAVVMDNLVKLYVDEPGQVTNVPDGNILVRCNGVSLDGLQTKHDVIIGDAVDANQISVKNVKLHGRLVVRGCASDENIENPGTVFGLIPSGEIFDVQVIAPYIAISVVETKFKFGHVVLNSTIKRGGV